MIMKKMTKAFSLLLSGLIAGALYSGAACANCVSEAGTDEIKALIAERFNAQQFLDKEIMKQLNPLQAPVNYGISGGEIPPELPEVKVMVTCSWFIEKYVKADLTQLLTAHGIDPGTVGYNVLEGGSKPRKADYNFDGTVGLTEVQRSLSVYVRYHASAALSYTEICLADSNDDGAVTLSDAQTALQYYTRHTLGQQNVSWSDIVSGT